MVATEPPVLDARGAADLLVEVARGGTDVLGALLGEPVALVELAPGDELDVPLPPWLPCVVVGMARAAPGGPAPRGVDVALAPVGASAVPPGWVTVPDVTDAVARLAGRVGESAHAAVVLVEVLRLGERLGVEAGLSVESLAYSALQCGPTFARWLAGRRTRSPRDAPGHDPVLVERHGDEIVLTLNRPHVRNAVNAELRDRLCEAVAVACADLSVELVLQGAGPAFSSGGDLDEFGTRPDPVTAHLVRTARSPARLLSRVGERATARVHGACVGAGIELAAFCHRVVAAPDTHVALPEVAMGLIPGAGGCVSIPRRVGRHRAAWLALSGEAIGLETATSWGLVDEVADPPR